MHGTKTVDNVTQTIHLINSCVIVVVVISALMLLVLADCIDSLHIQYNINNTYTNNAIRYNSINIDYNLAYALSSRNTSSMFDPIFGPVKWENLPTKIHNSFFASYNSNCGAVQFYKLQSDSTKASSNMLNIAESFRKYVDFINDTTYWYAEGIEKNLENALQGIEIGTNEYPNSSTQHYRALKYYPITNQNVMVAGSVSPWLETILLSRQPQQVTTVDYNLPKYDGDNIKFKYVLDILNVNNVLKNDEKFDSIFSFSSIEHDGLGRYGDPINPYGDFAAMYEFKYLLKKPNGTLYVGIPTADQDYLYFNGHRVYGPCRLEKLFNGWKVIDVFGLKPQERHDFNYFKDRDLLCGSLTRKRDCHKLYDWQNQPLFVLKPVW